MKIIVIALLLAGETGNIGGVVTDATGGVLRDCLVSLKSETGFLSRQQRTGGAGRYAFAELPVDRYRVSFALPGFQETTAEHVIVEGGSHRELDATLAREPLQVEIEVPAVASIDRKRSAPSVTVDRSFLEGVPSGRSPWSVLELTPGLVSDRIDVGGSTTPQQPVVSAAGTSYTQNQFRVNGVDVTDPEALGASATYYGFDSFEEIQVSTWSSDVEVQSPGVLLNIVLKNGGNRLDGGAGLYFEDDALQSDNLDDALRAQGVPPSNPLHSFYDVSAEVGGPIVRDRATFYASYGRERFERSALGFFLPQGELGVESTELTNLVTRATIGLGANQTLGVLFFRDDKLRPYRDAGRFRPTPETAFHQDSATSVFQTRYSRTVSERALLDARFDRVDLDFPLGEHPDAPSNAYSRVELTNGIRSGGPGTNQLFERDRLLARASLFLFTDEWLGGSHDWKVGWESGFQSASTFFDLTGAILYRDFFGSPFQVEVYSEPLTTESEASNLGLFVQDSYVRGRWVLNLGARFDRWKNGYPDQSRTAGPWEDFFRARGLPGSTEGVDDAIAFTSLAPRIGFTYFVTADGRTLLRGSYGRFYHQIGTNLASVSNPNGRAVALFPFSDGNGNRVFDEGEIDFDRPLAVGFPAVNTIDPLLAQPRTDEVTMGIERELARGITVSATLLYRKDRRLIDDVNDGVPDSAFEEREALDPGRDLAVGTGDDGILPVFDQNPETLGQDRFRLTNPEGLESRYRGLLLEAGKNSGRLQLKASLSLSESNGFLPGPGLEREEGAAAATPLFNDPNSLTNAEGRTFWDRPRILRIAATYAARWELRFASAYRYQTGQPMYRSILVNSTIEGDPLQQGPIEILAEPSGAAVQPAVHLLDVRAEKAFSLGSYGRLDLMLDVFNLLNANTATTVASRRGAFGAVLEVLPPRVARIGVRYRFGSAR